jgi:hypothetical protein
MPGYAFGLPAHASCPRSNGSICNPKIGCYACRGFYRMNNVQRSQWARFEWTREMLKTDDGFKTWIDTMVNAIRYATQKTEPRFRIHDSGDFFNPRYIRAWYEVCRQLPEVKFWAPPRVWQLPVSAIRQWAETIQNRGTR